MIRTEYLRFVQTLADAPAEVRKIANLVLNNLDTLIPLTTAKGQRIKKVVQLAQANWDTISSDIRPLIAMRSKEIFEQAEKFKKYQAS